MGATSSLENQVFSFGQTGAGEIIQCAIVNEGKKVPMGSMKIGTIEVPSFGPQRHPLGETALFGVDRMEADWSILSAQKDIWLQHRVSLGGFDVRFIGHTPTSPVSFVFFVKADRACVEQQIFHPKTLERYSSISKTVIFQHQNSLFSVTNLNSAKMELIPLAGGSTPFHQTIENGLRQSSRVEVIEDEDSIARCFWESNFLLAFEVPIHDGKVVFEFA